MTSNPLTADPVEAPRGALRLTVKPASALGGSVDGAWWPWSVDPVAEFPPLIAELAVDGDIRRVCYHLDSWGRTGRGLEVGEFVVWMEGFHATQPDTVTLIRADYTRVRLLVVPPGTPDDAAHAVLRSTATAGATETVEDILARNGLVAGTNPVHAAAAARERPLAADQHLWDARVRAALQRPVLGPTRFRGNNPAR
ncbi:DUF5994 family protein [Saccharothrix sp. BKS2]|uniref:DUF5994 family protein n=1 Tax=Saccharothrix sp. BKS2 TaxID=3064400 RepID=UPI0039E94792